jgi:hypothetical protein
MASFVMFFTMSYYNIITPDAFAETLSWPVAALYTWHDYLSCLADEVHLT